MNEKIPPHLPPELSSIPPQPCKVCGVNVWYNKAAHLVYHDAPHCQAFIDTMAKMGGIEMKRNGAENN